MSKKAKVLSIIALSIFFCAELSAQSITTASAYFKTISDYYATLKDYEADVEISADKQQMSGKVSYKRPDLLRIDFTKPAEQVIVFNGDLLTIYLPDTSAVLQQQVQKDGSSGSAALATPNGLALLSRYYVVAYEIGQDPVPLENGSSEKVMKLILTRRNSSEAFRYIKLAINPDTKLIRRVEAATTKGENFIFDFLDYNLNQDLSDQRFFYDPPKSANNFNNFLFAE